MAATAAVILAVIPLVGAALDSIAAPATAHATCRGVDLSRCHQHATDQVLIQRHRHLNALQQAVGTTTVKPVNCSKHAYPIQVLRVDDSAYAVRALQIESGTYETLWRIPESWTSPAYEHLNGCAIGPIDSIAYCSMQIAGQGYVVRLDEEHVEFVAKQPWSFRGAFGYDGTFYSVVGSELYALPDAHALPGFASQAATAAIATVTPIGEVGADLVVLAGDFEGDGVRNYLVSALEGNVLVSRISGGLKTWTLRGKGLNGDWYGAAWNYQNRIFFAANNGTGIWEVMMPTANFATSEVQVKRVGDSVKTYQGDGMNCMAAGVPWTESTCTLWGEPHIRVFDSPRGGGGPVVDMFDVGDYWVVKSELISIQGRYRPTQWTHGQAATSALAIGGPFLGGHTLVIESLQGHVTWDGEVVLDSLPSDFAVPDFVTARYHGEAGLGSVDPGQAQLDVKAVDLELPLGVRVTVNRWAQHVDARITMRPQSGVDGHCGNFNGDVSDDTTELIKQRMGAQVPPELLLFPAPQPSSGKQPAPVTLEDCPPATRARAEQLCKRVGEAAMDEAASATCVFDVCFGGEEYAKADAAMDMQEASATPPEGSTIRWKLFPKMCLDVGGGVAEDGTVLDGAVLQIWECKEDHPDMEFLLPEGGVGQIRWAAHQSKCLQVAGGDVRNSARMQFWECAPGRTDMQFKVGETTIEWVGVGEPAGSRRWCLDVRGGKAALGTPVQLYECAANGNPNQDFLYP